MTTLPDAAEEMTIPLLEETVTVGKRVVETARVRVSLTTELVEDVVSQTLLTRRTELHRVPIGREVTEVPQSREEDGVLIVPVVEEILVVEKRLFLKEEIHLRRIDTNEVIEQVVQRRVQHAAIERVPAVPDTAPSAGPVA